MLFHIPILYIWFIVIVICAVLEALTLQLCAVWFAVGGVAALTAASLGCTVNRQLWIFVIFSALLMALIRPFCRRFLHTKQEATNADRIIGADAVVVEDIDNLQHAGAVRVYGQIWTARSSNTISIPKGDTVRIIAIQGVKAIVEKL